MIKLAVTGAAGRMGARILALAAADDRFEVVAALEKSGHPNIGQLLDLTSETQTTQIPIQDHTDADIDTMIEFSLPDGSMRWLEYCLQRKIAMVMGTTGHTPEQLDAIKNAAKNIPLLKASNMSVGVNLMFKLAGQIASALGNDYDIEISETHHRFKKDAPSGTALTLRDKIIEALGRDVEKDVIYGRSGNIGQRPPNQIGMHALRVGDTIGEHEVHFGNLGETLVIKHSAHTRDTFVNGALRAAAWIVGKPPGLYDMNDVIGLA